ncbi:MAG: 16S rRNA (cytidine(1402)-2'-O)-methyltransferase [Alphaproteobacteria bacterium]|nr:16S rRNA (cytidine(1402)-2'-O)-methyltransferase [Alphaproteobacteria bacterium]
MAEYFIGPNRFEAPSLAAGLYVCATPIGNLGDVTLRVLATLAAADFILCEDTRVTSRLLERFGIRNSMKPYHEHNAEQVRPAIIAGLKEGKSFALVSDAGVPLVSDPGYRLVQACIAEHIFVTGLPGASAVLTALALSGLPTDTFTFLGFLPQKHKGRVDLLSSFKAVPSTLIAFESPHRVIDALSDIHVALGDRPVAVARELTKLHEEILRGTALEIHATLSSRESVKGEICIVIAPPTGEAHASSEDEIEAAITLALAENAPSKAANLVAKHMNMKKEDIYARILKRK